MSASVATHAETTQASSTTIAANMPAGIAAGDLLIAFIARDTAATITHPSGWAAPKTGVSNATAMTSSNGFALSFRHADGTEGSTQTWSGTSANWTACVMRITGCRAPQISGVFKDKMTCEAAPAVSNATTTVSAQRPAHYALPNLQYLALFCAASGHSAPITYSSPSGALTQICNQTSGNGVMYVGKESIDLTSNPNFGDSRQVTCSTTASRNGGWYLFITDPAGSPAVDKRHALRPRTA
jgi:hypothetical protein